MNKCTQKELDSAKCYRQKHKEKIALYSKQYSIEYRNQHKERSKEYAKRYKVLNREKFKTATKKYYHTHLQKISQLAAKKYSLDRPRYLKRQKDYYKKNQELILTQKKARIISLPSYYVKDLIYSEMKCRIGQLPTPLIELKRLEVKSKRLIKELLT